MPCRDWADIEAERRTESQEKILLEASMCAILTVLERDHDLQEILKSVDWNEAGVPRYRLEKWWDEHKAEDHRRKKAEAEKQERERLRTEALSKLTPEERSALGI